MGDCKHKWEWQGNNICECALCGMEVPCEIADKLVLQEQQLAQANAELAAKDAALAEIRTKAGDAYNVMIEVDGLGEGNMECEYVKDIEEIADKALTTTGSEIMAELQELRDFEAIIRNAIFDDYGGVDCIREMVNRRKSNGDLNAGFKV